MQDLTSRLYACDVISTDMISHVERAGNLLDSGDSRDSRDSREGRGEIRDIGDEFCASGPNKLATMTEEATPIESGRLVLGIPV